MRNTYVLTVSNNYSVFHTKNFIVKHYLPKVTFLKELGITEIGKEDVDKYKKQIVSMCFH